MIAEDETLINIKKVLKEELRQICVKRGWNYSQAINKFIADYKRKK